LRIDSKMRRKCLVRCGAPMMYGWIDIAMTRAESSASAYSSSPPAQIPACAANAPGLPRVERQSARGLRPRAIRRTAANRIDVASRLSVRTTAACRLFPLGEALPSKTSAGSCLPLFDRFHGTLASSDFSSAYMLGVRLLPSRAGPARLRARVRPPRFRAKNFSRLSRSGWRTSPLRRACSPG
jgi:hypothetical protein